jgi:hypothetical protein
MLPNGGHAASGYLPAVIRFRCPLRGVGHDGTFHSRRDHRQRGALCPSTRSTLKIWADALLSHWSLVISAGAALKRAGLPISMLSDTTTSCVGSVVGVRMRAWERDEPAECGVCGNQLLWWRSRSGLRVCMRCYQDPFSALETLSRRIPGGVQQVQLWREDLSRSLGQGATAIVQPGGD